MTRLGRRLATAAVLAAAIVPLAVATANGGPFEPFRRVFKEPAETLKGLVQPRSRNVPAPVEPDAAPATSDAAAETKAPPEPEATETAAVPTVDPAEIPLPRTRPDEEGDPWANFTSGPGVPALDMTQHEDAIEALIAGRSLDAAPTPAGPDPGAVAAGQPLGYAPPSEDIAVLPNLRPRIASVTADLDEERGSALAGALRPGGSCSKALSTLGVTAVSVDPIRSGSCGIPAPVEVAALGGGAVKLSMKAVINCDLASTLAAFMRDVVDPLAREKLGGSVTDIRVAAAYHCRTRNGVKGAKLSEHAKGNAIDISAFKVNGNWIEVGGRNGLAQSAFLREVRKAGCGPFTTVLGPGSDAYHSDHFHFDLAKRGQSGRGLYCR
ncbi:MAG TPA: extensin family protein [Bauldia sp.]|nr:extensin family protein [Bauldia sp.]